ncbi:MAG TPA: GAF domain-containing protein [Rhodopila sp.]|uniref:GAF domain-containing protein n=1 Tax=Rhodopila sp. TaxID=2480087 RepID=UPI002BFF475C|nr:GAF domain-containing protein [Rhodopila sp.]HVY15592.1 GAF domain-containing protein [Rhodopila sp.]
MIDPPDMIRLGPDPRPWIEQVAEVHARREQPAELLAALSVGLQHALGHILFTVLVFDNAAGQMRRIFSTRPDINPVGGSKPITDSPWMRQVLIGGRPYIGRSRQDLEEVFFDHEQLWAIGCESVLNMPVLWAGAVLGSLNLLHRAAWYDEQDIPTARVFAQLALPALRT